MPPKQEEPWHQKETELTEQSGIDNSVLSRQATLASILREVGVQEDSLVRAVVALGEGTLLF